MNACIGPIRRLIPSRLLFPVQRCSSAAQFLGGGGTKPLATSDFLMDPIGDSHEPQIRDQQLASVALVGAPNAGKSTLLNRLVGARVAAVSRKVNTTRRLIRGVYSTGRAGKDAEYGHLTKQQLLLWDTPGVVERHHHGTLGAARKEIAATGWRASLDADVTVVVVDASRSQEHIQGITVILEQLSEFLKVRDEQSENNNNIKHSLLLALNKADKVRPRQKLLDTVDYFSQSPEITSVLSEPIHVVSAYSGRGVDGLKRSLLQRTRDPTELDGHILPEVGAVTEEEDEDILEQHIWEKMLHRLHQEIPYQCQLEFEDFIRLKDGNIAASVAIRVAHKRHIPMVVGPRGEIVKWIAETAAQSCGETLRKKVFLKIRVALRSNV